MFEDIHLGGRMKYFSLLPEEKKELERKKEKKKQNNLKTAFGTNL